MIKEKKKQEIIRSIIEGEKYKTNNLSKIKNMWTRCSYEYITKIKRKICLDLICKVLQRFKGRRKLIIATEDFGFTK